jgi:acyl-CoA thioesterase-1
MLTAPSRWRVPATLAALVLLSASALGPCGARAEDARPCRSQQDLTRFSQALTHTASRISHDQPVTVVALGSSSTAGAGASSPSNSYPSRLAAFLAERFPGHPIRVLNRGVNGEEARDMLARLETSVGAEHPDLIIWQVGTNAVLRGTPAEEVGMQIRDGLRRMKALGADVVLLDLQFAPAVIARSEAKTMVDLIAHAAKEANVDLFPRFAVMRRWRERDQIPFEGFVTADGLHMNDWGYACVATLLGDSISEAVQRPRAIAGTTLDLYGAPVP